jgi:hypothetical protein
MSYLINDNLIWISTPKCASNSIETALLNSNLNLKRYDDYSKKDRHIHVPLNDCLDYFGKKESVCITRDWFGKWLSSLNHIWDMIETLIPFDPICKWEDVNNEVIYNLFDNNFINNLHLGTEDGNKQCFLRYFKNENEKILNSPNSDTIVNVVCTMISEKFWKSNKKCTYEFDIREMDKFILFMEQRFGEKLTVSTINNSSKRLNRIIINDELKSFVWNNFEKKFDKTNQLI